MANRIRKISNGYQVLTTPHRKYDVGFEFMLGSWTDETLLGFKVFEFNNYADAECEALRHPDINWEQLYEYHKDQYILFGEIIMNILNYSKNSEFFIIFAFCYMKISFCHCSKNSIFCG